MPLALLRSLAVTLISMALLGAGCRKAKTAGSEDSIKSPAQASARIFPPEEELFALIKGRVDRGEATGIVLAVREADGAHSIVAYGSAGAGALPLGSKSVFEIGSISKVFTGILLAEMTARGELNLEDSVQTHAHDGVTIPSRGDQPMRLVDLSTHTSGLPRLPTDLMPADPANPYADYTEEKLHAFLNGHALGRDVGAKHEYSNLGTGLLGHILAAVHGSDWEALAKDRILDPLGMAMSGVTLTPAMQQHLVRGHDQEGKEVSNWDMPTLAGAGALRSNAEDMLRFLDANLAGAETPLQAAMQKSHEPVLDAGPGMQVGLNWFIRKTARHEIVWHNGGTGGYRSLIAFDPARKVGVVVLENSAHGSDDIGFHLLDDSLALTEPPTKRQEVEVEAATLAEYVGVYEMTPEFRLAVTVDQGVLQVQATGQPVFPLFAESEASFFLKVVDAQITFVRGASGEVSELILHQGGMNQRAKRIE